VIKRFVGNLEKTIASSSVVLSSSIQKHFGPNGKTAYVKGQIIFMNSSILEIAIFVTEFSNTLSVDKYRLHYMDNHGQMLFRYDNAPHHHELPMYPHHKHTPEKIIQTTMPSLKDILNEISAIIIGK